MSEIYEKFLEGCKQLEASGIKPNTIHLSESYAKELLDKGVIEIYKDGLYKIKENVSDFDDCDCEICNRYEDE